VAFEADSLDSSAASERRAVVVVGRFEPDDVFGLRFFLRDAMGLWLVGINRQRICTPNMHCAGELDEGQNEPVLVFWSSI